MKLKMMRTFLKKMMKLRIDYNECYGAEFEIAGATSLDTQQQMGS